MLATQIGMSLTAAPLLDTIMITGCGLDPGNLFDLWWQHGPLDINTDLGCARTTDPGLILGSNPDLDVIMALGCTQIRMVPTAAWSSFTIMAPGSSSDSRHLHGAQGDRTHRYQHRLLGHFRASNKDLALGNNPAQPWTWVGSRPFLSACSSLL